MVSISTCKRWKVSISAVPSLWSPAASIQPILQLKSGALKMKNCRLGAEEILMALSISAVTNPAAQAAMDRLGELDGCPAHSTAYLTRSDEKQMAMSSIEDLLFAGGSEPVFIIG